MRPRRLLVLGVVLLLGCNHAAAEPSSRSPDASASRPDGSAGPVTDAGTTAGPDGSATAPTCFTNPTTYLEIINACTDAQAIDKQVDLSPMNLADGGLQPLP